MALHRSILPIKSAVKKPPQVGRVYKIARDNQGTENSMEFFRGKALALQTIKQITTSVADCSLNFQSSAIYRFMSLPLAVGNTDGNAVRYPACFVL